MTRHDHALGKVHVDRGGAHLVTQPIAGMHRIGKHVRMAEPAPRLLHVAVQNELADARGAHDLSVEHDGRDDVAADAVALAVLLQAFGRAPALVAEAEVVPDHDPADIELPDQ